MPRLRVALDVTPAISGLSGVARYSTALWEGLDERPDVELRAFAVGRRLGTAAPVTRVRVPLRVGQAAWRRLGSPRAERIVGDVDVVHSIDLVPPPTRRALVMTVHDVLPLQHPEWYPPAIRRAYVALVRAARRADVVVATCHATAAAIIDVASIPPDRVAVAEPGWERPAAATRAPEVDGPYVLAVGGITPRKGYEVLARAAALLGDRCPPVLVAGGDWWRADEVRREVRAANPGNAVRFLGPVDQERLDALFEHATIVCHPSLGEGFGLPCLEAMGRGRPVVASDLPPVRELVGDAGLLVPPADADALAAALDAALADPRLRDRLGSEGATVAATYTWDRMVDGIVARYREVSEGSASRHA